MPNQDEARNWDWVPRDPWSRKLDAVKAALLLTLLAAFVASSALAGGEVSEAHTIVAAGASQSTTPGVWEFHPTYSVSVLRLDESGQGLGGRVTLLLSPEFAGVREFSADAVARLANDGPLYLKVSAGTAWLPADGWWPPRLRAGAEVGLTAIRSAFGLEAGIATVYTFPPSRPGGGEWVISAGIGILWGFGAPSRAPVLSHIKAPATGQPAWSRGGFAPSQGLALTSGMGGVVSRSSPAARSETQPLRFEGRDVIHQILLLRKPGDVMSWWNSEKVDRWTQPLSALEEKYIEAMSSPTVPEPIRMWPPVTPASLTADQVEEMEHLGGKLADRQGYSNWKIRHRILKHYFMTHPANIRLLMQLYAVSRDANLLAFSLERGWQMGSGKEMFTEQDASRLGAAAEFFTMLATTVAGGKLLNATRPVAERGAQPLEPAGSGSAGEVPSPDATGKVIPLDRARPARTPSSPAERPLPAVDEQPLAATGTDGVPVRRQAAFGNEPTVASLQPPGQGARRGAAAPPPPRSAERVGDSDNASAPATSVVPPAKPALPKPGGAYKDVSPEHHLMTNKNRVSTGSGGPWTPRFEAMAKRAGMTLEDAANKVAIPGHRGPHPQAYHEAIYERLREATRGLKGDEYSRAFKAELDAIRAAAATPGTYLNRLLTGQ